MDALLRLCSTKEKERKEDKLFCTKEKERKEDRLFRVLAENGNVASLPMDKLSEFPMLIIC